MKNFKAKELLKDKLIAVFIDSKCVICNEEKECLEIVTTPYSTLCVCLDCLQYQENKLCDRASGKQLIEKIYKVIKEWENN